MRGGEASLLLLGGSGGYDLPEGTLGKRKAAGRLSTPFGPSNPVHLFEKEGFPFYYLSRHGEKGYDTTAPYVNYRANVYAAKLLGAERIVAWTGPGVVSGKGKPGDLALPDDLLDLTRCRPSTFYEGKGIGFIRQSPVFCPDLSGALRAAWKEAKGKGRRRLVDGGTYACTEGPRLETAAEIRMLSAMGASYVGMTLCPEAFLARELEICYAAVAYLTNWAEGVKPLPYRKGTLFEGMLPERLAAAVEEAKNAIPALALAAGRRLAGEGRGCPCSCSMERYRRKGVIGDDFRAWVAVPEGQRESPRSDRRGSFTEGRRESARSDRREPFAEERPGAAAGGGVRRPAPEGRREAARKGGRGAGPGERKGR